MTGIELIPIDYARAAINGGRVVSFRYLIYTVIKGLIRISKREETPDQKGGGK
ncbi:hypothetical protein LCGC14_2226550 [marine sediment metagenome]|uniref:Uncharacterized protein n=1 Tax=marine sediment metagenome TaxID=412755 RepID=A0A0F9DX27_9ZZZZ